jgi:hypothetical protein
MRCFGAFRERSERDGALAPAHWQPGTVCQLPGSMAMKKRRTRPSSVATLVTSWQSRPRKRLGISHQCTRFGTKRRPGSKRPTTSVSGSSEAWYRAGFGTGRSRVRIPPSRPLHPPQRPAVWAIVFALRIGVPHVGSLRRPRSASALTLISRIINQISTYRVFGSDNRLTDRIGPSHLQIAGVQPSVLAAVEPSRTTGQTPVSLVTTT